MISFNILNCKHLKYTYPNSLHQLQFDFSISTGDFVLILGNSGSGKSTLISLIAGFLEPSEGNIFIYNKQVEHLAPHQRDIALLFQSHNTFPHLSVFENVALGLSPSLSITLDERKEIYVILQELEIDKFANTKVKDLSGGQQQRVGLARCLLQKKSLILLDEPFSALEPSLRKSLTELLAKKSKDSGKTVLLITHFPDETKEIASHVIFLENGIVYKKYSVENFFSSNDKIIKKYLMSI